MTSGTIHGSEEAFREIRVENKRSRTWEVEIDEETGASKLGPRKVSCSAGIVKGNRLSSCNGGSNYVPERANALSGEDNLYSDDGLNPLGVQVSTVVVLSMYPCLLNKRDPTL